MFILYAIGAANYLDGSNSFLAQLSGSFIDFLRQPGGIAEMLQNIANSITGGW